MISNTSEVPTLSGAGIQVAAIKKETELVDRRTKIVCTIGPACWEVEQLEQLIDAGLNVARFNFSHGDHEGHGKVLGRLREAAKNKDQNVAVMLDTKGPEIRTGFLEGDKVTFEKGQTLEITTDYDFKGNSSKISCSYESLPTSVKVGSDILIADGSLTCRVTEILQVSLHGLN